MTEECRTDLLSDYIDDELEPVTRREVEEHVAGCGECRLLVAELRKVIRRAGASEDLAPYRDLWPGIAARIGSTVSAHRPVKSRSGRAFRRISLSVPQLLAAGIGTILLVGTAGWLGARWNGDSELSTLAVEAPSTGAVISAVSLETRYDAAVAELMAALERERDWLNPRTIRVVEANLLVIDAAIEHARRALELDPESEYVRDHLERTVRQKLGLLRRVADMASRS